ncbi:MAG: hypothetical protein H0U07_12045 [Actinobacteria bacterium]|nr:hypothetical protein [Actinomycetota bacterium]
MLTALEIVAREEGAFRRAQAEAASVSTALRLARREERLQAQRGRLGDRVHRAIIR